MGGIEAMRGRCGDCIHFDTQHANNSGAVNPLLETAINSNNEEVAIMTRRGYCRAKKGLVLGMRTEDSLCAQSPVAFSQKTMAPEVVLNNNGL